MNLALEYSSVTINEMARELGASRTTISNYLHGRTQPRRSDLITWALRCGVPFDWLVGTESDHQLVDDIPEPEPAPAKKPRTRKTKAG